MEDKSEDENENENKIEIERLMSHRERVNQKQKHSYTVWYLSQNNISSSRLHKFLAHVLLIEWNLHER